MFDWVFVPQGWIALLTLTALEIILGIDNIVFISVIVGKLPQELREKARRIGLGLAVFTRLLLLSLLFWLTHLTIELFTLFDHAFSIRDLVLIIGGLFLLWKSTMEIHNNVEGGGHAHEQKIQASFFSVVTQIALIDIVFSLDSVITAIGIAERISVMAIAIILSVIVMVLFARKISEFVERHPTIKILALSFLLMIGLALIADGFGLHIPKGYIYFAMAFSIFVETLNLRMRRRLVR